ncbi:bisphosphoglycerate mutase isoform 2-T2 [Rhynchocyon petersi]
MSKYKLIMLRHGEGAWNKENRFCSWVDQKLNSEGLEEARNCGKQLKELNFEFDLVFTSILNRSIHTAWLILEELGQEWVPVESSWRLNERHYGALIGLNREKMALNHGEEQVSRMKRLSTSLFPLASPSSWSWMKTCVLLDPTSSWATRRRSRQPSRKWRIKGK